MVKTKKKLLTLFSAILLMATLLIPASANAAVYIPAFEPDSPSNPHIFNVGDWSYPTLTPGDIDYFKFTNTFSYTRTYTLIVESPTGGYNYFPSHIYGNGILAINPIVSNVGYYRYDIVVAPGAVVNIEVEAASWGGYSPNNYFIVLI